MFSLFRLVDDLEMNCFAYTDYGKRFVKEQKLSPDSYIQMAQQLAFYRLHKVPGAHYESASTRRFLHGRTETIRSCSVESVRFAQKMLNPKASGSDRILALKDAIVSHKNYTVDVGAFQNLYSTCPFSMLFLSFVMILGDEGIRR